MTYEEALFEVIRSRRSVRTFTDQIPDQALLDKLIEAAQWAPSNHNRQGWKFLVFRDRAGVHELAEKVGQALSESLVSANRMITAQGKELLHFATLFEKAPVTILALHKKSPAVGKALLEAAGGHLVSSEAISTAMAVQNMLLTAHALGLGACVMTAPLLAAGVWKSLPEFPAGFEPTCLVAVGHAAESPSPPRKKPLEQIVEYR